MKHAISALGAISVVALLTGCTTPTQVCLACDGQPLTPLVQIRPRQPQTIKDRCELENDDLVINFLLNRVAELEEVRHQVIIRREAEFDNPNFDPYHRGPFLGNEEAFACFGFSDYRAERKRFREQLELWIKDLTLQIKPCASGGSAQPRRPSETTESSARQNNP